MDFFRVLNNTNNISSRLIKKIHAHLKSYFFLCSVIYI